MSFVKDTDSRWSTLSPMLSVREGCASLPISDNEVLIVGGQDNSRRELATCEVYNVGKQKRQALPAMKHSRYGCALVKMDQNVYVLGGFNSKNGELNSVEVLDLTSSPREWRELPHKMNKKRACCTAVVIGSRIYVAGGCQKSRGVREIEMFDCQKPSSPWKVPTLMDEGRIAPGSVAHGDKFLILGGIGRRGPLRSGQVFDTSRGEWRSFGDMPRPRSAFSCIVVGGHLVVLGGLDGEAVLNDVDVYHHQTRTWRAGFEPLLSARSGLAAVLVESAIVVLGGQNGRKRLASVDVLVDANYLLRQFVQQAQKDGKEKARVPRGMCSPKGTERTTPVSNVKRRGFQMPQTTLKKGTSVMNPAATQPRSRDTKPTTKSEKVPPSLRMASSTTDDSHTSVTTGDSLFTTTDSQESHDPVTHPAASTTPTGVEFESPYQPQHMARPTRMLSSKSDAFYLGVLSQHERESCSILTSLTNLVPLMSDVYHFKVIYTMSSYYYRVGELTKKERISLIELAFQKSATLCTTDTAYAINRLHLKKAYRDGVLAELDEGRHIAAANRAHIENADFVRALQENARRIDSLERDLRNIHVAIRKLETNIARVHDNVNRLAGGLRRKFRVEACVGLVGAVLNAVSFGAAGSAAQSVVACALCSIVDFSDVPHLCDVAAALDDTTILDALEVGLGVVEDLGEGRLEKAVNRQNSIILIGAVAGVTAQACGQPSVLQFDDFLDPSEERNLPLHAAVNHSDMESFMEELHNPETDFNKLDGNKRSPADFAAIKGEDTMMHHILQRGGTFNVGSKPAMRKYAKRAAAARKQQQEDELKLRVRRELIQEQAPKSACCLIL